VYLPAGTVHAVGGGVLIAEIQQTSDATFRLFDWNRRDTQGKSRALHIEESLASIHWNQGPVEPVHLGGFKNAGNSSKRQTLVQSPHFHLEFLQTVEALQLGGAGSLQALIILQGQGRWRDSKCPHEVKLGDAWVLPASLPRTECLPESPISALLCTLPDQK
jgi:mannose-6-phosphate isomerase